MSESSHLEVAQIIMDSAFDVNDGVDVSDNVHQHLVLNEKVQPATKSDEDGSNVTVAIDAADHGRMEGNALDAPIFAGRSSKVMAYCRSCLQALKIYWSLMLGNILEWYEFSAYGYLVPEIRANFFQNSSLLTWVGFGLTFVMRPLGGIFIGWLSDRFGRRLGTTISLAGMIIATAIQGCLPSLLTNSDPILPVLGTGLLLLCRMFQGLFAGGEISAVSVTLVEHRPQDCLGFVCSFLSIGGSIAFSLSSGLVALLHLTLSREQMLLWGWRIPFIIPVIPGLLALALRVRMPETPAFKELSPAQAGALRHFFNTIGTIFSHYKVALALCMGASASKAVSTYMGSVYTCDFITKHLGVSSATSVGASSMTQLITILVGPLTGFAIDYFGIGKVMLVATAIVALTGLPLYAFLIQSHGENTSLIVIAIAVFSLSKAITGSCIFLWALELFETSVRTTAIGLSFNISMALFGGFGPVLAEMLATDGMLYGPGIIISVSGLLSVITIVISRWMHHRRILNVAHIRPHPY